MGIDRKTLCVGLLTKTSFLTLSYPRKVLFSYDEVSQTGYDVLNDIYFGVHKKGKDKNYYISWVKELDSLLESLGYPEVLEDVHIQRIMGEDFGKIFVESAIEHSFYSQSMEKLTELHFANDFNSLKHEFVMTEDEERQQRKGKVYSRKKGWL